MNLLITTQKVDMNDAVLGFFHSWLKEFARHVDKLTVICLYEGEYDLPGNVKVLSLGKENIKSFNRVKYFFKFYNYIWQERNNYDKVFIHMNSEYIVLGGAFWKIWKKKISLWYVHRATPWQLRIAEKFVDVIFTASKESFQLESTKVEVVGHGIDLNQLKIISCPLGKNEELRIDSKFQIIYVGRISRIKNQKLLIKAINNLKDKNIYVKLVGAPLNLEDEKYQEELKNLVKKNNLENQIKFIGAVPNKDIVKYYNESNLAINLCPTGGMDKAVLEAMACGLPTMVINQTFHKMLDDFGLILQSDNTEELANKIQGAIDWDEGKYKRIGERSRKEIEDNYSLNNLVEKIIENLKK